MIKQGSTISIKQVIRQKATPRFHPRRSLSSAGLLCLSTPSSFSKISSGIKARDGKFDAIISWRVRRTKGLIASFSEGAEDKFPLLSESRKSRNRTVDSSHFSGRARIRILLTHFSTEIVCQLYGNESQRRFFYPPPRPNAITCDTEISSLFCTVTTCEITSRAAKKNESINCIRSH